MRTRLAKLFIVLVMITALIIPLTLSTLVSAKHYSEWSHAEKITELSTPGNMESCPFITKDGLSLYYASNATDTPTARDLYVSQRTSLDAPWGVPEKLYANINTPGVDDRCPYVTPDGRRLIFVKQTGGSDNFYMSTRQDKKDNLGWGNPVTIDVLNSSGFEFDPSGFENEEGDLVLYFGSSRTGKQDIYQTIMDSNGNFSTPTPVTELNGALTFETMPIVRKDGLELYFTKLIIGDPGSMDIWVSTRNNTSEPWANPIRLGSNINSPAPASEIRASLTWDGMNMIFSSTKEGTWDLYQSTRTKITDNN